MDDERVPGDDRAEQFERYLAALTGDERPSPQHVEAGDEAEMARLAAEITGSAHGTAVDPDAAFVEQLRLRMRAADDGLAAVLVPPPVRAAQIEGGGRARWRISRRHLLRGGLGAAAGLAAGAVGISLAPRAQPPTLGGGSELVAGEGFWQEVARVTDLPDGAAMRFTTAAFDGFVVNDGGDIHALSSVCSHMGCTLHFRPEWSDLRCPCHGASFDLSGRLANGRRTWRENPYRGDARAYPIDLPDLVRPRVMVDGDRILVWTAQA